MQAFGPLDVQAFYGVHLTENQRQPLAHLLLDSLGWLQVDGLELDEGKARLDGLAVIEEPHAHLSLRLGRVLLTFERQRFRGRLRRLWRRRILGRGRLLFRHLRREGKSHLEAPHVQTRLEIDSLCGCMLTKHEADTCQATSGHCLLLLLKSRLHSHTCVTRRRSWQLCASSRLRNAGK